MAEILRIPSFTDSRGTLSVLEKVVPFDIKRVYYIYNVPSVEIIRGGHRHKKTRQALICINGYCTIRNNDGTKKQEFVLDTADKCLIINEIDWHEMTKFSSNAILLVLASENYDVDDYIDEPYR